LHRQVADFTFLVAPLGLGLLADACACACSVGW
jgi:hypothetical protein